MSKRKLEETTTFSEEDFHARYGEILTSDPLTAINSLIAKIEEADDKSSLFINTLHGLSAYREQWKMILNILKKNKLETLRFCTSHGGTIATAVQLWSQSIKAPDSMDDSIVSAFLEDIKPLPDIIATRFEMREVM